MRHADLRHRLLRAAEQEIMANGLARTSLRGIARRVGVSHQATAHHFDDRAGLFTALAVEGFGTLRDRTEKALAGVEPGGAAVALIGATYLQFAQRHPTMFDVMFRPELLHGEDPALTAARQAHWDLLTATVEAARETGWGRAIPTDELAVLGWASVHGLAVLQRDAQLGVARAGADADLPALLTRVARALDALG